jgi:hypothetical protein
MSKLSYIEPCDVAMLWSGASTTIPVPGSRPEFLLYFQTPALHIGFYAHYKMTEGHYLTLRALG